jgi:hypothetical protein
MRNFSLHPPQGEFRAGQALGKFSPPAREFTNSVTPLSRIRADSCEASRGTNGRTPLSGSVSASGWARSGPRVFGCDYWPRRCSRHPGRSARDAPRLHLAGRELGPAIGSNARNSLSGFLCLVMAISTAVPVGSNIGAFDVPGPPAVRFIFSAASFHGCATIRENGRPGALHLHKAPRSWLMVDLSAQRGNRELSLRLLVESARIHGRLPLPRPRERLPLLLVHLSHRHCHGGTDG